MSQNRIKNTIAQFWISPETDAAVRNIATAEGKSVSAVYRELVEKGLVAGGYKTGSQDMAALVREAVQETLRPHVDRLAAISAKGTQISAAAFFMAFYNGRQAIPPYAQEEYDELAAQARKLGIEYLKLSKDKDIDAFIGQGLRRMGDDNG